LAPRYSLASIALLTLACDPEAGDPGADIEIEKIAGASDGLSTPTDLAFNSARPDELWVVNHKTDEVTIIHNPGDAAARSFESFYDPAANHFLERVSSIAFSDGELFGSCQNSTNTYDGQGAANNFMGPTLWTSDLDIFALSNPLAVDFVSDLFGFPADLGSHLDMLHESPNCMGIEWDHDNVYWVFDGEDGAIVRYDFAEDHGPGFDDHSDGIISRYVSGDVKRVKGIMSHLALDHSTGLLYIADTGNGRIAVLDTQDGREGDSLPSKEPGTDHHEMRGVQLTDLVVGLTQPSGIAFVDDHLVVTEHGTGLVHVYDLAGLEVASFDTALGDGALAGIWADSLSELWYVDSAGNAVYRMITPL
jgi:hypothetical protein